MLETLELELHYRQMSTLQCVYWEQNSGSLQQQQKNFQPLSHLPSPTCCLKNDQNLGLGK